MSTHPYVALLDRIVAAAEAGDAADLYAIYTDDAVIWHNHDGRETTVAQNARLLELMATWVDDRRYEERVIDVFDGGAVQRHVLRGRHRRTGDQIELHACAVVSVNAEGRITRLDEYIDSAEASRFAP